MLPCESLCMARNLVNNSERVPGFLWEAQGVAQRSIRQIPLAACPGDDWPHRLGGTSRWQSWWRNAGSPVNLVTGQELASSPSTCTSSQPPAAATSLARRWCCCTAHWGERGGSQEAVVATAQPTQSSSLLAVSAHPSEASVATVASSRGEPGVLSRVRPL
jgi:hypothetical protein